MKIRFYKDSKREWRWSVADSHNGKILAVSSEGYTRKRDCVACFEKVTRSAVVQMVKNDLQLLINTINSIQDGRKR